jgi:hypothetical protein
MSRFSKACGREPQRSRSAAPLRDTTADHENRQ